MEHKTIYTLLPNDSSSYTTHHDEQFIQVHLDERFYVEENQHLVPIHEINVGNPVIGTHMKIFYEPDACIDFISSYEWKKIFLTLNDTFRYILPLIHNLPQIVYIYIYSVFPDKVEFKINDYPKLRAIVKEGSHDTHEQLLADIEIFKRDLLPINVAQPIKRETKLLTNDPSKTENFSSSFQTQIDNLSIIWIQDDDTNLTEISTIDNKINSLQKFIDIDECINYIHSLNDNVQIFFISLKLNNDLVLPLIISLTKIRFIYIFQTEEKTLNQSSNKIRGIYFNIDELCDQLLKDYKEYSDDFQISMSIFDKEKNQKTVRNLHEDNARFLWFQLLVDILLKIPHNSQTINEMLDECEKYEMKTKSIQTENFIKELRENYQSNKALEYYTGAGFLYCRFNQALRTENIDFLFVFRFFLSDMYNQLQQLYTEQFLNNNDALNLFRGQYMTTTEFNIIKHNVGRLISINTFFSTTKYYDLACIFAGFDNENKSLDTVSVVFQIEIDDTRHSLKRPFASLQEVSKVKDEGEILFSIGTIFRIENIESVLSEDKNWYVQLKLVHDDDDNEISELRNDLEKEFCGDCDLCSLGAALIKMGEYDKAERYFQMILEHISQTHPNFVGVCTYLGIIYCNKGNYQKALDYHQQELTIHTEKNQIFDNQENIGVAYTHIGQAYQHLGNKELAMKYYTLAAEIQKLPRRIAYTYNQIATIHQESGDYQQALEYFQKVLNIDKEVRKLNKYDPSLATTYNNIGDTYIRLEDYDSALKTLQHALDIRLKGTNPTHTDLAAIYHNLGTVYQEKNCLKEALEMLEEALKIDTQALPENHISLATTNNNIGTVCIKSGDLNKALYHLEKAVNIMLKSDAKRNDFLAVCQLNLAGVQLLLGNLTKALNMGKKGLDNQMKSLPENDKNFLPAYLLLSQVYEEQRNIPEAMEYLEKYIENARLSVLPYDPHKFLFCQKQYDIFKSKHFSSEEKFPKVVIEQAEKYDNTNEQDLILIQSNEELERTSLNDVYNRINLLNTIGALNSRKMNFETAMKVFNDAISVYNQRQALTMIDEQNLNELMVAVYFNSARLYYRLKNWGITLQNLEKSLDLALRQNQQHPMLAEIYNLLGITYTWQKELSRAEYYNKLAIETAKKILPNDHPDIQRYYMQLKQLQVLASKVQTMHS